MFSSEACLQEFSFFLILFLFFQISFSKWYSATFPGYFIITRQLICFPLCNKQLWKKSFLGPCSHRQHLHREQLELSVTYDIKYIRFKNAVAKLRFTFMWISLDQKWNILKLFTQSYQEDLFLTPQPHMSIVVLLLYQWQMIRWTSLINSTSSGIYVYAISMDSNCTHCFQILNFTQTAFSQELPFSRWIR